MAEGIRFGDAMILGWIIRIVLGIVLLAGGYIGYTWLNAYLQTKAWPREPMFICDKHGPINKNYIIQFSGVDYCSLCFHEKLETAEKIR